ncbi:DHA2 family efflux MFS transporter permease subunit [Acidovorax sp. Be4]|uniref:DHA2 family efflux MFS transporter permease subunit n=1 Tax=Acidovorax bellezanensis TaxID=2976702 RepID=A0ABT2PJD9_9BURK|nr:DHA2 family efflux MFS transporter permease subunit [Acidovorax sp. Be4]MCT9810600.1 DHA2 family efflux MFS transporter permease subunit [Acidovorax sp. Be4]
MHSPQSSAALKERYGERYRWLLLLSVLAGTIASIIPSTSMNLAIPALSAHFRLGQDSAQWVASGFMVASTMAMLTTPWLLSRYGYRSTYAAAILLLMAGGIVGGLAQHYPVLLAARVAEGLAAGIIQPIPAVIILYAFPPNQQGRAGGLFGMGVVLAPAIAPTLGGLLVDWMGWRSTFFMVLPPAALSLWLAWRFVPTSAPGGAERDTDGAGLDWVGLTLATVGTLCLLNGLATLQGGTALDASVLLASAVLCLWAFIAWQRRLLQRGSKALMDLRLFRSRPFVMGCIVSFIYGTAMFGSTYLLPLFIQQGLGLSATQAGTLMLPAGLVLAITIPLVGRMADTQPTHWLVGLGLGLLALSFTFMHWVDTTTALWLLASFIVIGRIGLGFILPSLNLGTLRPLDRALIAQGASTASFLRMLGGATGVGLAGIVLEWRLAVHSANAALSLPAARMQAFHDTFWLLTLLCLLALCAASQLRAAPPPAAS